MTRMKLEKILSAQIPLSNAMGIKVVSCDVKKGVAFRLPLNPNRNHKNTAFGGTLVAAQALACWSWIMSLLAKSKIDAEVVLQTQSATFLRPVAGDFKVKTLSVLKEDQNYFIKTLTRHGKARLSVHAVVMMNKRPLATYTGEYVAIKHE